MEYIIPAASAIVVAVIESLAARDTGALTTTEITE